MHGAWKSDWFKQTPKEKRPDALRQWIEQRLVPNPFKDSYDLLAAAVAVSRTGLAITSTVWDGVGARYAR